MVRAQRREAAVRMYGLHGQGPVPGPGHQGEKTRVWEASVQGPASAWL